MQRRVIEIDRLQTDFEEDTAADEMDPTWSETLAVSKPGDLWVLGSHKVLCDNARSEADLAGSWATPARTRLFWIRRTMCALAERSGAARRETAILQWRAGKCLRRSAAVSDNCVGQGQIRLARGRDSFRMHGLAAHRRTGDSQEASLRTSHQHCSLDKAQR